MPCYAACLQVDDSRKTLAHAVAELHADIAAEREAFLQTADSSGANGSSNGSNGSSSSWVEPELGIFVLHNKLRPKLAELPEEIMHNR
jgi:hypoxanthine phosphoribosyltransferase